MADPAERAELALSVLARLIISLVMPLWALAMVILGVEYRSAWWLGTGIVVGGIGLLLFCGSPLIERYLQDH